MYTMDFTTVTGLYCTNCESLQRDHSMLTFENAASQGAASIIMKLQVRVQGANIPIRQHSTNTVPQALPFSQIKHQVTTLDAQPSSEDGGILVLVTGALLVSIFGALSL